MAEPSKASVEFVEGVADKQIDLTDFVDENREKFSARYMELLNAPDERNPAIEEKYVNYFMEVSIDSFNNPDVSAQYWGSVLDALDRTFDEINEMPTNQRGNEWHTVRNIMSAASWEQAWIEVYGSFVIGNGIKQGKVIDAYARTDFDPADFEGGMNIRKVMEDKLEQRKAELDDSPNSL